MTNILDRFGLSPQERRFVVIVAIVVFVVINWWVIIPMFGDWGRYEQKIRDTRVLVDKYNAEISKEPEYTKRLKELERQGTQVPSEEAALRTQQEVVNQANLTGLGYGTITPLNRATTSTSKTNNFFDEAGVNVSINTGEKELIDFLVRLADKDLLIRAKSMDIGPDPSQMRLHGNLTLVKSFQRKIVRPTTTTTPTTGTPASKPAATTPAANPSASTTAKTEPKSPPPVSTATTPKPGTPATNAIPTRTLPKPVTK